jgi:hypothetical protein
MIRVEDVNIIFLAFVESYDDKWVYNMTYLIF